VGVVLFGGYAAWRDRFLPVPRRAPIVIVLLFIAGYILLLGEVIVERWLNLGERIDMSAWLALAAVTMNVVAVGMLVRSSQPGPGMAERQAEFRRTVALFRKALSDLDVLNQMNWERCNGNGEPPHSRYADTLTELSDENLEQLLTAVQARRAGSEPLPNP
jgi:hypothetical protein